MVKCTMPPPPPPPDRPPPPPPPTMKSSKVSVSETPSGTTHVDVPTSFHTLNSLYGGWYTALNSVASQTSRTFVSESHLSNPSCQGHPEEHSSGNETPGDTCAMQRIQSEKSVLQNVDGPSTLDTRGPRRRSRRARRSRAAEWACTCPCRRRTPTASCPRRRTAARRGCPTCTAPRPPRRAPRRPPPSTFRSSPRTLAAIFSRQTTAVSRSAPCRT